MTGSAQFERPPGVSTEAWSLYERLPRYTLSKAEIFAVNTPTADIHTHRSYRYNGWDFNLPPGVFMPGATSRIIHDRILDGTIPVAGKCYAGVGVGLGVEAILAGACGSREVFAMDVHPGSVQAAAAHYHRLLGERADTKFHALVSDLFEEFPDSTQADVVTFNPPAINERITNDPDMVRNLCMGTEIVARFFRQIAERDLLTTDGDVFLVISNTAELRKVVGHALSLGFSPEVVHAQTWDGENVRTYLFRFQRSRRR
jgi:release factor glutamine methyltransferase